MNIPIWIKSEYVTYIGNPSFLSSGGSAPPVKEGKPPWLSGFPWTNHSIPARGLQLHSCLLLILPLRFLTWFSRFYPLPYIFPTEHISMSYSWPVGLNFRRRMDIMMSFSSASCVLTPAALQLCSGPVAFRLILGKLSLKGSPCRLVSHISCTSNTLFFCQSSLFIPKSNLFPLLSNRNLT